MYLFLAIDFENLKNQTRKKLTLKQVFTGFKESVTKDIDTNR